MSYAAAVKKNSVRRILQAIRRRKPAHHQGVDSGEIQADHQADAVLASG